MLVLMAMLATMPDDKIRPTKLIRETLMKQDYPRSIASGKDTGEVYARVTVGPDAGVERCEVILTSGAPIVDQWSCKVLLKTKFTPPLDETGKPTYGVYVGRLIRDYVIESRGDQFKYSPLGIYVKVDKLPKNISTPLDVSLNITVNDIGQATFCALSAEQKILPVLANIACSQTMKTRWKPAITRAGSAVASVQQASVYFLRSTDPDPSMPPTDSTAFGTGRASSQH